MGQTKVLQVRAVGSLFMAAVAYVTYSAISAHSWLGTFFAGCGVVFCSFFVLLAWDVSRLRPADSHTISTLLTQYVLYRIFYLVGWKVVWNLHISSLELEKTQANILMDIIEKNKNTMFGKMHNFEKINSVRGFRESVPLTQYKDYEGLIARIEKGEKQILTEDEVVFLALTSGTTGKNKVIPITHHMKGPAARQVGPLMYHYMEKQAGLNLQRTLVLSYKGILTKSECGLEKGPVSAHMSRYMPFVVSPRESYDVTNEVAALHIHAVFGLQETEVGHIEALMSTLVYSFWKYVEHNFTSICDDIEKGTLNSKIAADPVILNKLNTYLSPNPKRARELRHVFQSETKFLAKRIWPNLRFVRMLTTGGFAHHANYLRDHHMCGVLQISQAHAASEGFFGFNVSSDPNNRAYTAMINYAFMEFIPVQFMLDEKPKIFQAGELRYHWSYEVILTTPMGLYRYRTGDIVKIVGHFYETPVYVFEYRVGQTLNLCWEKTDEKVFYEAVKETVQCFDGVTLNDYTATENVNMEILAEECDIKHYCLFVELEKEGKPYPLKASEEALFDEHLCRIFELYQTFRSNDSIAAMRVKQLRPGTFLRLKSQVIEATQNQQYKVPRVTRNKDHIQYLLSQQL